MKFQAVLAIGIWLLPLAGARNNPAPAPAPAPAPGTVTCEDIDCQYSCGRTAGCEWKGNKCSTVQRTCLNSQCSLRTTDCEDDDKCMKLKGSCVEVNQGVAVNGSACQVVLDIDNDKTEVYKEVTTKGCAAGFICSVENANGTIGEVINGTCAPTECLGKKVPGNCNDNVARTSETKDQCEARTQRVTICHRTCSRKNPWVRITIDEDAWNGQGCGHQQHDVRDECKNKFPWTEWGVNRKDYLLKFHGTRDYVASVEKFQNAAAEKAYWRMWEPACPYVRNGHCCQWNSTTNPCCGEPPSTVTPVITHKKYAGPPGSCNAAGVDGQVVKDATYTNTTGSSFVYCYVTSVPSNAPECLYAVSMKDPAPIGGTGGKDIAITGDFELLCPGNVSYVEGPIVQIPSTGEGPIESIVTGVGAKSGKTVTSKDPAAVAATPVPVYPFINIKKYAGPKGKCTDADIMNKIMKDDTYTLPTADTEWQYCYVVSIPSTSQECLSAITMIDTAPVGGTGSSIPVTSGTDQLCVGNPPKIIEGKVVTGLSVPEGPVAAVVTGTGVTSKSTVQASDPAAVNPPPVVDIKKYAGPKGSCNPDGISGKVMEDVTYTLQSTATSWQYCYVITVPPSSPECLLAVTMSDPAPGGGGGSTVVVTEGSEELCPNATKYVVGSPVDGLTTTEGPYNATVTGTGKTSGIKVTDVDDATVVPAPIPAVPAIEIKKYAGPDGACASGDLSLMQDILYTLPLASSSWQYCYVITVPSEATECLSGVTMADAAPNGLKSYSVTTNSEQLCKGNPKFIPGLPVPGLSATEGPFTATVNGTGVTSKEVVYDDDDAKVSPPPNPLIEVKKYAGPEGGCSATAIQNNLTQDVMYTLPSTSATWQYCYLITVPVTSTECLFALTMNDPAPGAGAGNIALPEGLEPLCPTKEAYIPGPPVTGLTAKEGPHDVTVTGTGVDSKIQVSDVDDATVLPPAPEVLPVVEIKKYAGPAGSCIPQAITFAMKDDVYQSTGEAWQYCYNISVPSTAKECLQAVKMSDPAPIGGGNIEIAEICPGQEVIVPGKEVPSGVLKSTEGPINATVTGTGVTSKKEASAQDGATVNPPNPPDVVPVVEIKKYAGPVGGCVAVDFSMDDEFYQVPYGATWQYCYKITVPVGAKECLLALKMTDPAPIGGGAIDVAAELCAGQEKYIPGKEVPAGVLTSPEGPHNATVTGTGKDSGKEASSQDYVTVIPPPPPQVDPVVEIKKYAGPDGKCSEAGLMDGSIKDETYTLPSSDIAWQYCYKISVPSTAKECLLALKMTDPAPIGGGAIDVAEELCPGKEKYVPGKTVTPGVLTSTEGPTDATVTGTGKDSKKEASAKDSAAVTPPNPPEPSDVVPVVEIKKYAGPDGKCTEAGLKDGSIKDETYTLPSSDIAWQYCYKISVPSTAKECLLALKMTDPAPIGGGAIDVAAELCPGQEKYVPGKTVAPGVLTSTEGPTDATVTGTGKDSKKEVSAKDSAAVKPPGGSCPSADLTPPACPEDVFLMSDDKDEAETEFDVTPIRIVSQKGDNVTFTITNPFDSDVLAMYYQYATTVGGSSKCDAVKDFAKCQPITVTAHCMRGSHPLAIVDVWFVDPAVVDPADKEVVPKCCQPDAEDAAVPTVVYSFMVSCDSRCVQAPKRILSESTTEMKSDKAELCSLEQFGCGDDGKSVNVCHYSAKDGYQTYCVPQADSDVVAYFPKDYCGPCVGGYANVESTI